ncbi:uncharacterized protein LOC142975914 [Anticarsia gemmatalis]|uniref:uncharacterized protein LOC142975914 n=1 Tax=Anticarsia gemmatalis TaxID=129554 RepID=UPI003F77386B
MIRKVLLMLCTSALVSAGVIGTDYSPATSVSYSSLSNPTVIKTVSTPIIEKTVTGPDGYTKIIQSPPVYESILTTKESKFESPDGTQHSTFTKSLNTAYSSAKKFESKSSKDGDILANTIPGIYSVHSPVLYHPQAYTYSSPLVHTVTSHKSVSLPITYTTHNIPLTKTIVSPSLTSYATPVFSNTKYVTSGISSYSTPLVHHTISSPIATKTVLPVSYTTHALPLTKTLVTPSVTSYTTPVLSKKVVSSGLSSYSSHTPVIEAQPIKSLTYSEAPIVSHMSFSGLGASYAW